MSRCYSRIYREMKARERALPAIFCRSRMRCVDYAKTDAPSTRLRTRSRTQKVDSSSIENEKKSVDVDGSATQMRNQLWTTI